MIFSNMKGVKRVKDRLEFPIRWIEFDYLMCFIRHNAWADSSLRLVLYVRTNGLMVLTQSLFLCFFAKASMSAEPRLDSLVLCVAGKK